MSYYSLVKLRGATGQSLFAFDFPYLKREDVRVFVDGTAVSFTFTSPNTIELVNPLTKASDVVIRRFTETGRRLVDYNSVAELTEEVLDMDSLQAFYIVQEALDTATDSVVADIQGNWDAKHGRIINVADPIDDTDAMNRRTFFELNGAYTSKMEEWLRQAREAVNDAVEEANRARDEANRAADIQELTQAIHDGTAEIKAEAEKLLTLTVEERIKAEAAVVASKEWADKSAYWYDVFRSIYLGLRSEHPGGEVVNGAVYFNTTDNRLYFYTGSQWYSPTTDADRAEAARRFVESMRNEVSNMRDQTQVYSQQAQDFVTDAQDAANAAGMSAGTARNEAAAAANHAKDAEISAGVANERASAADGSAKLADAAAGRAEAAAAQVGETFGDRGGWYVAHGMPTKPMRSSLWTVMDGGELDGVEWNVGDMLVYSIKTNSFGRITGASITPSEPAPIEAEEGLILGDGKSIRARVSANIRWIAHANSEGVKLGDNAVELHLLGNNMVFGALKHPVFHKGNLPSWDDVTGKPETFPVGVHAHKWDEITGKPAAALRWPTWFEVTDKPTYFPPVTHGHSWNEITNKPDTALRWPTLAEVGAAPAGFGLGTEGKSLADKSCNDAMESGFYSIYSSTTDTPYGSGPSGSGMMVVRWGGGAGCFQLFFAYTAARIHARRRYQDQWLDWFELYSTSKKPTAADVGALPATGGNLTGKVQFVGVTDAGGLGRYALDMNNHNIGGLNALVFNDPSDAGGEGIFFPKTGKNDGSTSMADYDVLTALDGTLLFNGEKVSFGDVNPSWGAITGKPETATRWPTPAEVGAAVRIPLNLSSATTGRRSCRLLTIGLTDNSASFMLTAQGDFGQRERGWYFVSIATRGKVITINTYLLNGFQADPLRLFWKNTGSAFEVWGEFSDYNNNNYLFPLGEHGATYHVDNMSTARDWTGFTEVSVNRIYTTNDKPTAADVKARPDNWVPSWGDVTGKPTTFPAAAHGHSWSEINDVPVYAQRWPTAAEAGALPITGGRATGTIEATGSLRAMPSGAGNITIGGNSNGYAEVVGRCTTHDDWQWTSGLRFYDDSTWRVGPYKIYHQNFKPTPGEIGAADLNHGHARQFGAEQSLSTEDLDTIKTPGVYAQHANANTSAARHYPENLAGSLIVTVGAGVQQRYHVYNTSRIWTRAQYNTGGWTPWAREYNTANKPTAADVGLPNVPNTVHTTAPTANTVAVRDSAGDLTARLMRSNYQNETGIAASAQLVFRNSTTDNYLRFCSNPAAVRGWLGVGPTRYTGVTVVLASLALVSGASGTLSQDVRGHEGRVSMAQNGYTQSIYFRWPVSDETFQIQIGNDHAIFTLTNSGRTLIRRAGWSESSSWTNWCILTG